MNHQQICGPHWRYPRVLATNPCSQLVVGEAVLGYSRKISTHEQLDGSPHLYEHLLYTQKRISNATKISNLSLTQFHDSFKHDAHGMKISWIRSEGTSENQSTDLGHEYNQLLYF